jgi:hypothetical protein
VRGAPLLTVGHARLLSPLPTSRVGIPDAIREQSVQIGKVGITVDEEVQAFAIVLARPLAVPRLPPRIVGVEVQAAQRLPAAMVTAFDVAARAMAFADRRAAIRAWFVAKFTLAPKAVHGCVNSASEFRSHHCGHDVDTNPSEKSTPPRIRLNH